DAEAGGFRRYASVLGSGINYDGRTNGITAPSGAAQVRLLRDVYERSGVEAGSVGWLVAHGRGTWLGDRVGVKSLAGACGGGGGSGFCALTSFKRNVGHAQAA